ncbi:glycosyltransferase, partial [Plasticicumulans sp.]|uniref:glycosyltransferase n=1 Tax=Plasticicumulans sp. TaxID=2307179 RepID=UPI002CCAD75D
VLGRGIDTARFDPARRDPRLRAAWGAVDDAPVVLGVGRLAPEKNWALVLQAWAAIRSAQPRARLVLAGEGPMRACLRAALPEASFCGELPPEQLAAIYASADLFLFPSLTETWGNVTAEAMASGLAVVAYRRAGAAELIRDGVSGALAEPGDAAGFIGAALALAADRERCRRLGAAARQVTLGRGWDAVVLGLERSYHDVLNGRHGHGQRALDVRFDA